MNRLQYLAHIGEEHSSPSESTVHIFESQPVLATVLSLLLMIFVALLISNMFKKKSLFYNVLLAEFLIVGMVSYSFAPALSIICITVGFFLALSTVLFGGVSDR